jgi:F0F1-type ATP synthase epsilon subunit
MTTKSADGASSTTMNMSQGNIQLQKNDLVNNISSGVTISGVADATKNDQAVNLGQMNRTIDAATSGAATASAKADTATTAANTASTKADAATNTANTANTKADAATATATQAKTMSTTALSRVDAISGGFTAVQENMNQLEQKVSQVEKDSFRGIAALAAINNAPQPHKVGNTTFAVGFGGYKSESAIGLSMAHQVGQAGGYAVISGGIGYAMSGDPVYKVGAAWEF